MPSRIPNLLVNGSSGIAVGMATNIPPHNLREVAAGVQWALSHPEASDSELLDALIERAQMLKQIADCPLGQIRQSLGRFGGAR